MSKNNNIAGQPDIWFTSDLHLGHKNIVRGLSRWKEGYRDFDTLEEYNQTIIDNVNNVVKQGDVLYSLGDFSMGNDYDMVDYRKAINVRTIHHILGNHDKALRKNKVLKNHHKGFINARNLFTSVDEYLEKKIHGTNFVLFHYPIASFHHGSTGIHCHGHLHLNDTIFNPRGVNVCIDNHPEMRPFHIDEIKKIINERTKF